MMLRWGRGNETLTPGALAESFNRRFSDSVQGMTGDALTADAVLRLLPARPRLLALGEPTHGEDRLLDVRDDLFRPLVEQAGYRAIAIESDCLMGLVVDDYVTSGVGTLDEAMEHGFSHGFGASAANRELVRWMRAYNDGRPEPEQVRFAGFDGPLEITHAASPRRALTALHAFLAARVDAELLPGTADTLDDLLGADDRWADQAAMMDPSKSVGRTPDALRLRLLADDLVALLDAETPHLKEPTDGWDRARLYGRTAAGLLRYHYWLADTSPGRMAWLLGVRASMMAANLLALARRRPTLVFAGNAHLQRPRSSMRLGALRPEWWSAGAIVDAELGDGYAFLAMALGTIHRHGVTEPPVGSIEAALYSPAADPSVVDPRSLDAAELTRRVSPWYGYAPLDPAHLTDIDGIVFVSDV